MNLLPFISFYLPIIKCYHHQHHFIHWLPLNVGLVTPHYFQSGNFICVKIILSRFLRIAISDSYDVNLQNGELLALPKNCSAGIINITAAFINSWPLTNCAFAPHGPYPIIPINPPRQDPPHPSALSPHSARCKTARSRKRRHAMRLICFYY